MLIRISRRKLLTRSYYNSEVSKRARVLMNSLVHPPYPEGEIAVIDLSTIVTQLSASFGPTRTGQK